MSLPDLDAVALGEAAGHLVDRRGGGGLGAGCVDLEGEQVVGGGGEPVAVDAFGGERGAGGHAVDSDGGGAFEAAAGVVVLVDDHPAEAGGGHSEALAGGSVSAFGIRARPVSAS